MRFSWRCSSHSNRVTRYEGYALALEQALLDVGADPAGADQGEAKILARSRGILPHGSAINRDTDDPATLYLAADIA